MKRISAIYYCIIILSILSGTCFNAFPASDDLPLSAKLAIKDAQTLIAEKNYSGAITRLTGYLDKQKKDGDSSENAYPMVSFVLGNCYLLNEDYNAAVKYLKEAVVKKPVLVEAWLNLGKAYYDMGKYAEAAESYNHAYNGSDPVNPDYLFFSAVGYMMAGQNDQATGTFKKLFKDHADRANTQWRENYVHTLLAADQPRQAIPLIKNIILESEDELKTKWQETLLYLYVQLEMYQEAITHAIELTHEDCTNPGWWKGAAHVYLLLKEYKDAFSALTIYGYLTPLTSEEKKILGDLSLQLNIPVCATPVYEELLREKPDKNIIKNLMSAYQSLGCPEEALARLNEFYPGTDDPELCMLKADILFGMKRFQEAGEVYCLAATRADAQTAGRVWLLAGYAAWRADDFTASLHAFEKASKYSGQRRAALLALAQLKKTK
ncbi:MAG: tetratricopeptide repeat protein [Desulfobacteraceae bacterium]|jgi:tetratricopeptide (TPR) repeat protein